MGLGGRFCDLPHQPGPMPKEIIDLDFEAGFNVFGVLRADDDTSSSFVHVQRAVTTEEMYSEADLYIDDATVQIERLATGEYWNFIDSTAESLSDSSCLCDVVLRYTRAVRDNQI